MTRQIIKKEDHALIPLLHNKFAIIDLDDIDRVKNHNWFIKKAYYSNNNYVATNERKNGILRFFYLHKLIAKEKFRWFKNGNTLDCRKQNIIAESIFIDKIVYLPIGKNLFVLLDLEDYEKVKDCNLKLVSKYVYVLINNKYIHLARFIINCPKNKVPDHINHNVLDNRKCNLRIATFSQNQMNRKKTKGKKYKGIYFQDDIQKWVVRINWNKKKLYLGAFKTDIKAAQVYDEAAKKYFGEFAKLNFT